jgi:hypothetical protein
VRLGFPVGVIVGKVGRFEGMVDGILVERNEGITVGPLDGDFVGFFDGAGEGATEVTNDGILFGEFVGVLVERIESVIDGTIDLKIEGLLLDEAVGDLFGILEGEFEGRTLIGKVDDFVVGGRADGLSVVNDSVSLLKKAITTIRMVDVIFFDFLFLSFLRKKPVLFQKHLLEKRPLQISAFTSK